MWRNLGDTMWNPDTGVSYLPGWVSVAREMLSVAPAGAGVLAAVAGLALRGRWLRYLEIGLWLLTLGSFVSMARVLAPFTGLGLLYGPVVVAVVCGVGVVLVLAFKPSPFWRAAGALAAGARVAGGCQRAEVRVRAWLWDRRWNRRAVLAGGGEGERMGAGSLICRGMQICSAITAEINLPSRLEGKPSPRRERLRDCVRE